MPKTNSFRVNLTISEEMTREEIAAIVENIAGEISRNVDRGFFQTVYDKDGNDIGRYCLKSSEYFVSNPNS